MATERNKRIAAFRKVSGYLIWVSMPLLILCGLIGTIGLIGLMITPEGDFSLQDLTLKATMHESTIEWIFKEKLSLGSKIFCVAFGAIDLLMTIFILFHFQQLIEGFYRGDIFNKVSVTHARKAFKMNLYSGYFQYGFQALGVAASFFLTQTGHGERITSFLLSILFFLITIGFLSLLLWALEIGTDLNEETELTI